MYGWVAWFDTLSNGDYTKWAHFEKMKAEQLLPLMQYHIIKAEAQREQYELERASR